LTPIRIKYHRLMGEELVLYKDWRPLWLVDRHCPHRRADLSTAWSSRPDPLQLSRLADGRGRPRIEQPYDDVVNPGRGKRCSTKAYPVKECAGLLFAYMGPQPVPELPIWEPFTLGERLPRGGDSDSPQLVPVPGELMRSGALRMMHENWNTRLNGAAAPYSAKHSDRVRGVRLRLCL